MDDGGVYYYPFKEDKEPKPVHPDFGISHIFKVLAASDKPLEEFDIVQGVLRAMAPGEVWYQTIAGLLGQLSREGRIFCFEEVDGLAAATGIHTLKRTYSIANPLDGLSAL